MCKPLSAQLSVALSTECLGDAVSLNQLQPGVQVSGATAVLSRDCYKFTAPQPQPVVVAVKPQARRATGAGAVERRGARELGRDLHG